MKVRITSAFELPTMLQVVSRHSFVLAGVLFLCLSGCVDVQGPPTPRIEPHDGFASLDFTTKVAFIKKGDTLELRLVATAIDGSSILMNSDSIRWSSSDSSLVYVDTLGRIVGRDTAKFPVEIIARYTHAFTTRTDTIDVYVTPGEIKVSSIKITALDSTRVGADAVSNIPRIRIDLFNTDGQIQNPGELPVYLPSPFFLFYRHAGGPNSEPVYLVGSSGTYFGNFWIKASFNLYGTEVRDSIEFGGLHRYKLPTFTAIESADGTFSGNRDDGKGKSVVQPCAIVAWLVSTLRPIDIVFSDSLSPSNGCDTLSDLTLSSLQYLPPVFKGEVIGGNLLNIPSGVGVYIRRSNTIGEVKMQVLDAETKEPLNIGGRYQVIEVKQ